MKPTVSILKGAILLFLLQGCGKERSDSPCSHSNRFQPKRNLGTAHLDGLTGNWIRIQADTVRFVNSNGGVFYFTCYQNYGSIEEVSLGTEPFITECWDAREKCYNQEKDEIILLSEGGVIFNIFIERIIDIYKTGEETINDSTIRKHEQLNFKLGKTFFSFYLQDSNSAIKPQYIFFDSTYSDILVCENKETRQGVYPSKFILQRNVGLIGFELSNKEQWKRQ